MPNDSGYSKQNFEQTQNEQDMNSDFKAFLRVRKQFKMKQGILYRKSQVKNNDRARLQLVLPTSHRQKAMAGCHDQIGHLG